jgi:hypothetical protein
MIVHRWDRSRSAWGPVVGAERAQAFDVYERRPIEIAPHDRLLLTVNRRGDAKVFKKYSHMKLQMKREPLQKLNRTANESAGVWDRPSEFWYSFGTVFAQKAKLTWHEPLENAVKSKGF